MAHCNIYLTNGTSKCCNVKVKKSLKGYYCTKCKKECVAEVKQLNK